MKKAIVFTDIKSSSVLWKYSAKSMEKALTIHDKHIRKFSKGLIVKTIGDAYMIAFDKLEDALLFAIQYSEYDNKYPIKVGKMYLRIRIGICYGDILMKKIKIQGKQLVDFFGSTVNKASRMESKVSPIGGFAVCMDDNDVKPIIDFIQHYGRWKYSHIAYKNNCKPKIARSRRLIAAHDECRLQDELHGVGSVNVIKCMIN